MPAPIDTVVFDIGNVLIPWNPRWLFRQLLPDDASVVSIGDTDLSQLFSPAITARLLRRVSAKIQPAAEEQDRARREDPLLQALAGLP